MHLLFILLCITSDCLAQNSTAPSSDTERPTIPVIVRTPVPAPAPAPTPAVPAPTPVPVQTQRPTPTVTAAPPTLAPVVFWPFPTRRPTEAPTEAPTNPPIATSRPVEIVSVPSPSPAVRTDSITAENIIGEVAPNTDNTATSGDTSSSSMIVAIVSAIVATTIILAGLVYRKEIVESILPSPSHRDSLATPSWIEYNPAPQEINL